MKYVYLAIFLALLFAGVMIFITGREMVNCNETFKTDYNQVRFNADLRAWSGNMKCDASKQVVDQLPICYSAVKAKRTYFFLDVFDTNYVQTTISEAQLRLKSDCPNL